MESFPVPKEAPTAIRDQNSYVAHRKGTIPIRNTIVLVVGDNPSILDGGSVDGVDIVEVDESWEVVIMSGEERREITRFSKFVSLGSIWSC